MPFYQKLYVDYTLGGGGAPVLKSIIRDKILIVHTSNFVEFSKRFLSISSDKTILHLCLKIKPLL